MSQTDQGCTAAFLLVPQTASFDTQLLDIVSAMPFHQATDTQCDVWFSFEFDPSQPRSPTETALSPIADWFWHAILHLFFSAIVSCLVFVLCTLFCSHWSILNHFFLWLCGSLMLFILSSVLLLLFFVRVDKLRSICSGLLD